MQFTCMELQGPLSAASYVIITLLIYLLPLAKSTASSSDLALWSPSFETGYTGEPTEYCETEYFEPWCEKPNQIVVITSAMYGRMSIGRCVQQDYGYVGCKRDVWSALDRECSGRRSCNLNIPNAVLDKEMNNTCPQEFKTYLNASYICVEAIDYACDQCAKTSEARVHQQSGYLSSIVSQEKPNCGTKCPWLIEVEPGQKIRVVLLDFSVNPLLINLHPTSCSTRYATIREVTSDRIQSVCGGTERMKEVFLSIENSLQITILNSKSHFLLYYEAVGCPDYVKPKNTWLRREDKMVVVGCDVNDKTWRIECVGNTWQGTVGQCPLVGHPPKKDSAVSLPLGVLIAIVVGIALIIGVLILTIGVVCLKRQHQHPGTGRPQTALYIPAAAHDSGEEVALHPSYYNSRKRSSAGTVSRAPPKPTHAGRENIYARSKMEQRPLPSIPNIHEVVEHSDAPLLHHAGKDLCAYHGPRVLMRQASSGPPVCKPVAGPQVPCPPPAPSGPVQGAVEGAAPKSTPTPPVAAAAKGTASGTGTPASSKDDPQYFVLDPDQQAEGASGGGELHKSPEEENAENINKETGREPRPPLASIPADLMATRPDTTEDLEVWVLMLRSQNYYIV